MSRLFRFLASVAESASRAAAALARAAAKAAESLRVKARLRELLDRFERLIGGSGRQRGPATPSASSGEIPTKASSTAHKDPDS